MSEKSNIDNRDISKFNTDISDADWIYWLNIPFLDELEIALLSLGIDPEQFTLAEFNSSFPKGSNEYNIKRRIRLIRRAMDMAQLPERPNLNQVWQWIDSYNIEHNQILKEKVHSRRKFLNYYSLYRKYKKKLKQYEVENKELPNKAHKRIKTISQVVYAIAWAVFEYGPDNNSAVKNIHHLTKEANFDISEDAIRNLLNDSYIFIEQMKKIPDKTCKYVYTCRRKI